MTGKPLTIRNLSLQNKVIPLPESIGYVRFEQAATPLAA
jgi:hypothetical protein